MDKKFLNRIEKEINHQFALKNLKVKKIKFFGSAEFDDFKNINDIDVVIISDNFNDISFIERSKLTRGIHLKMVEKFNKPFDMIYLSTKEWKNKNLLIGF